MRKCTAKLNSIDDDNRLEMLSRKKFAVAAACSSLILLVVVYFRAERHNISSLPSVRQLVQQHGADKLFSGSADHDSRYMLLATPKHNVEESVPSRITFGQIDTRSKISSDRNDGYMLLATPRHVLSNVDQNKGVNSHHGQISPHLKAGTSSESLSGPIKDRHSAEKVSAKLPKWVSQAIIQPRKIPSDVVDMPQEIQTQHSNNIVDRSIVKGQKSKLNLFSHDNLVRNCITGEVIGQVPSDIKKRPLPESSGDMLRISPENGSVRKTSFRNIFRNKTWGHSWDGASNGLDVSGRGATLLWTQEAIAGLHAIILQLKTALGKPKIRILDAPCGDMTWMSRFLETRDDVEFVGIDVVPELIAHHNQTYKDRGWTFLQLDIVEDQLPGSFDLIISRAFLQHLYDADVLRVLEKFSRSGSKYLFTTTFAKQVFNVDLDLVENPGRFRELNLEIPPVSLMPPLCIQRDGPPRDFEGWKHFLGLWALPLTQVVDCDKVKHFRMMNTEQDIYSCIEWSPYIDLS